MYKIFLNSMFMCDFKLTLLVSKIGILSVNAHNREYFTFFLIVIFNIRVCLKGFAQ